MSGISDLILAAQTSPPKPIVQGLLNESEIAGLHGAPEVFKTIFCLQLAESLASGAPLLGTWQVPKPQHVYFLETEMSVPALGLRLAKMFAHRTAPDRIHFADEARLRKFRRAPDLKSKFALLSEWMAEVKPDVLIIDTANPFFRGKESPNDETAAGAFFDLLEATPASVKLFVRHNHKPRIDDPGGDAATKIRGSGQFSDVPDLLLELRRIDKRTNEAALSISKFRHGTKPDDLKLWLDTEELRLVPLPPVIYLLQTGAQSRFELLEALAKRFGIQQRAADSLIKAEQRFLKERLSGHKLIYEIDWSAAPDAEWSGRVQTPREKVEDMQGCISCSVSLATAEEVAPPVLAG